MKRANKGTRRERAAVRRRMRECMAEFTRLANEAVSAGFTPRQVMIMWVDEMLLGVG